MRTNTGMEAREAQIIGKRSASGEGTGCARTQVWSEIEMDTRYRNKRNTTETEREKQRVQTNVYLNMLVTGRFEPCFNYGLSE
jgi:hypothetical protein